MARLEAKVAVKSLSRVFFEKDREVLSYDGVSVEEQFLDYCKDRRSIYKNEGDLEAAVHYLLTGKGSSLINSMKCVYGEIKRSSDDNKVFLTRILGRLRNRLWKKLDWLFEKELRFSNEPFGDDVWLEREMVSKWGSVKRDKGVVSNIEVIKGVSSEVVIPLSPVVSSE